MTYQEILHEIGYWLDKSRLNCAQYQMLGELTMIFCDEFTSEWPPYVNGMMVAVIRKMNCYASEYGAEAGDFMRKVKASVTDARCRQVRLKKGL